MCPRTLVERRYGTRIRDEDVEPPNARKERLYRLLGARRLADSHTSTTSTSTSSLGTASTIVHFVSPSASSERAAIAGAAPARAHCSEMSCPIPCHAPVTSRTLPSCAWEAYRGSGSCACQE